MKYSLRALALSLLFITSGSVVVTVQAADVSFDNNLLLLDSSDATVGNILKNDVRFIHNYGPENTFIGKSAGNFTLAGTAGGHTGVGFSSLLSLTTGLNNSALGHNSLTAVTSGGQNTAVGAGTLRTISTVSNCTGVGYCALLDNTAAELTAVGSLALRKNTSGIRNTAVGYASLYFQLTGRDCTAVGYTALGNATGINNTALGSAAGLAITTGDANIIIGAGANVNAGARTNCIVIGTGATTSSADNQIRIGFGALPSTTCFVQGIRGVTTNVADAVSVVVDSNGQLGTVSSSMRYKKNIAPLGDVTAQFMNINPVSFEYIDQASGRVQYGFIAEEFAEQFPDLVVRNDKGEPETIQYHLLWACFTRMIQDQQRAIENLQRQVCELEDR